MALEWDTLVVTSLFLLVGPVGLEPTTNGL